jgi:hypothetical protein
MNRVTEILVAGFDEIVSENRLLKRTLGELLRVNGRHSSLCCENTPAGVVVNLKLCMCLRVKLKAYQALGHPGIFTLVEFDKWLENAGKDPEDADYVH